MELVTGRTAGDGVEDALELLAHGLRALGACGAVAFGHGEPLVELHRLFAGFEAFLAEAVGAFDASCEYAADGAKSAASWLARRCGLPETTARREARLGRSSPELPIAWASWRRGEITSAHVNELARLARGRSRRALAESEELLVQQARELRFEDFQRACNYFEQLADPDGADAHDEERRARRDVTLTSSIDGSWFGRIVLDPISGEIVSGELRRIERELWELDWAAAKKRHGREPLVHELSRTSAQRRADALVEMATRSASTPEGSARPAALISVLVDYPTLHGRICELASGRVVAPGSLLPWLDQALVERAVFGPTGRVEIGARRRLFDGATRRAIELRDRHCTHPFCSEPAESCQVDHVVPYDEGGLSTQENGRLLCGRHNRDAYRAWLALGPGERARLVQEQRRAAATLGVGLAGNDQAAGEDDLEHTEGRAAHEEHPRRGPPPS